MPRFTGALAALPLPRINDQVLAPGVSSQGVRLLAPRYTWEGELVTKLGVGARPLHVLVALGGERAASIATREGGPEKAERARSVGRKLFDQAPSAAYPASIEAIEHVLRSAPPGAPPFAHTEAWRSYCTWAALGSWICLHHSWELHAKEVVNIYGSSQRPAGYVVPCPEAFEKLGAAAVLSSRVLERSGAFENDPGAQGPAGRAGAQMPGAVLVKEAFDDFVALMEDLARVSRKQIANDDLTVEERRTVAHYGNRLGRLHLYPGDKCFQPEDDLPLAVLFSTENPGLSPLIERYAAIGRAMDVYAIRNTPGEETRWIGRRTLIPAGLQLYHGATLSVYELERPATGERLTGVTWKALLDSKDAPALLRWASDFAARLATVTPRPAVR